MRWLAIGNDPGAPAEAISAGVIEPHRADGLLFPFDDEVSLSSGYGVGAHPGLLGLKTVGDCTQEASLLRIGTPIQDQRCIVFRCITEDQGLAAQQSCFADPWIGGLAHRWPPPAVE